MTLITTESKHIQLNEKNVPIINDYCPIYEQVSKAIKIRLRQRRLKL
jgi:hypothetical protein